MEELGHVEFLKTKSLAEKIFSEEVFTTESPSDLVILSEKAWLAACIFNRFMIAKSSAQMNGELTSEAILAQAYKDAGLTVRRENFFVTTYQG